MAFLRAVIRCNVYRKFGISGFYLSQQGVNLARGKFSVPPASVFCGVLKSTHAASAIGYDTEVEGKSSQQHPRDPLDLTFEDNVAAFKSKTTWEILRAYVVYTMCSYENLVEHNMTVRKIYCCILICVFFINRPTSISCNYATIYCFLYSVWDRHIDERIGS